MFFDVLPFLYSALPSVSAYPAMTGVLSPAAFAERNELRTVSGSAPASACDFAIGSQMFLIFGLTLRIFFASSTACAVCPDWIRSCTCVVESSMLFGNFARPRASVSAAFWNWLSDAYAADWRTKNEESAAAVSSFTISSPMTSAPLMSLAAKCTSHCSLRSDASPGLFFTASSRSEEHTSELQSRQYLV